MDGLRATEVILRQVPTRVIIMSLHEEPEYLSRAMVIGARGYLVKPFTSDNLINTIRAAARRAPFPTPPPSVQWRNPAPAGAAPSGAAGEIAVDAPAPASPAWPDVETLEQQEQREQGPVLYSRPRRVASVDAWRGPVAAHPRGGGSRRCLSMAVVNWSRRSGAGEGGSCDEPSARHVLSPLLPQ
jgi:DNA-binding response OmpR family regulator